MKRKVKNIYLKEQGLKMNTRSKVVIELRYIGHHL